MEIFSEKTSSLWAKKFFVPLNSAPGFRHCPRSPHTSNQIDAAGPTLFKNLRFLLAYLNFGIITMIMVNLRREVSLDEAWWNNCAVCASVCRVLMAYTADMMRIIKLCSGLRAVTKIHKGHNPQLSYHDPRLLSFQTRTRVTRPSPGLNQIDAPGDNDDAKSSTLIDIRTGAAAINAAIIILT